VATKKDLLEAQAFSRRRLVTAFVSGAPGGREVEPVRPGRVLIGGIVLSVLLMAGAAVAGFLLGRPPYSIGDLLQSDSGGHYVIDARGQKYALRSASVPDFIGYGTVDPLLVPSAWLEFFEPGVSLSTNGARRVPEGASRARQFSG